MVKMVKKSSFPTIVLIFVLIYIFKYILEDLRDFSGESFPPLVDISVLLVLSIVYFFKYRRNNILCFELMFFPILFLGMFFNDLIFAYLNSIGFSVGSGVGGALFNAVTDNHYVLKSRLVQILGYLILLLGACFANEKRVNRSHRFSKFDIFGKDVNYKAISIFLTLLLAIELIINYKNGNFDTWYGYEDNLSDEERNLGLGHIDCLCLVATVFEFVQLSKKGISSFAAFLRSCNKIYLLSVIFVGGLLLITGNRSEALMIVLPIVVSYNALIQRISGKVILPGLVIGAFVMVFLGITRAGDASTLQFDIYSITRDYSLIDINCTYLIKYTDEHGPSYFIELFGMILSGIPYIGPNLISILNMEEGQTSTIITTDGMGMTGSGLGTSIVGDVYYTGKILFVIIYMFFLGYMMSRLHSRFTVERKFNIVLFIIYIYILSDSVYYVRSQWAMPVGNIIYDLIIVTVASFVFRSKNTKANLRGSSTNYTVNL